MPIDCRTAPGECPLSDGNLVGIKLFIHDANACLKSCQADQGCNFYMFYPAEDGKPTQCFFYETCRRKVEQSKLPFCILPFKFPGL